MLLLSLQTLLVFLFPLAVYCWLLGMINRRAHPMVVGGRWDFVGLLFAASGFLLVVGPVVLSGVYSRLLHELPLRHQPRPVVKILGELMAHWWGVFVSYYVLMSAGALFLLWWRGRKTIVYNIKPAVLDKVLADTLDRVGAAWTRQGKRLHLTFTGLPPLHAEPSLKPEAALPPTAVTAIPERLRIPPEQPDLKAVLDVEPFAGMSNVTLHWRSGSSGVREEVETELTQALASVETEENPAGTWLLAVSTCLFALMFVCLVVIVLGNVVALRRW